MKRRKPYDISISEGICSVYNLFTLIVNLFIWRNKKVILFGSWMGDKFTDNPRFMFQYLHAHRDEYDIKKLVWVTRNEKYTRC